MRVSIAVCAGLLVGLSGFAAICGSAGKSKAPAAVSTATTPKVACLKADTLPPQLPLGGTSGACITAVQELPGGATVFGAADSTIGIARSGRATHVRAAGATGAVSNLMSLLPHGLVAFVVDQGIGLFDPQTGQQVMLNGRSLAYSSLAPNVAQQRIDHGNYFALFPDAVRPRQQQNGALGAVTGDGKVESIALEEDLVPKISIVCATYIHPGALIEKDAVCVDVSDLVPPPPLPPPATPLSGSDACLSSTTPRTDTLHRIDLTVALTGVSPSTISMHPGETYDWTIKTGDGLVHVLGLYDAQGNLVRDTAGTRVCVTPPARGAPVTVEFALAGGSRNLILKDTAHPGVRAAVHVR